MTSLTFEEIGNVVFVKIVLTLPEKYFSSEECYDWKSIDMVDWAITKHKEILYLEENGNIVGIRNQWKGNGNWKIIFLRNGCVIQNM